MNLCEFKKICPRDSWVFGPTTAGKMQRPEYGAGQQGIPPGKERAIKRCPLCNKRLRLRAMYCIGGEFACWQIPSHAVRVTRNPGPKRQSKISGRGK